MWRARLAQPGVRPWRAQNRRTRMRVMSAEATATALRPNPKQRRREAATVPGKQAERGRVHLEAARVRERAEVARFERIRPIAADQRALEVPEAKLVARPRHIHHPITVAEAPSPCVQRCRISRHLRGRLGGEAERWPAAGTRMPARSYFAGSAGGGNVLLAEPRELPRAAELGAKGGLRSRPRCIRLNFHALGRRALFCARSPAYDEDGRRENASAHPAMDASAGGVRSHQARRAAGRLKGRGGQEPPGCCASHRSTRSRSNLASRGARKRYRL